MSLHLYQAPHPSISTATELRILMAFEAGSVECWTFRSTHGKPHSVEGIGWERLWDVRFHAESGLCLSLSTISDPTVLSTEITDSRIFQPCAVMAMGVSRDSTLALSVSADHLVGRYDLKAGHQADTLEYI